MRLVGDATVHGLREVDEHGPVAFCGTRVPGDPFDADPVRVDCAACRRSRPWKRHAGDLRPGTYVVMGRKRLRGRGQ